MSVLRIGPDWATQVRVLRDAITEDTNLIRFDNGFYRLCKARTEATTVRLEAADGRRGIELVLNTGDLYVSRIDGRPFERYASTLDQQTRNVGGLSGAVHDLPRAQGTDLFQLQSLLVFCVCESLRSDAVATSIEQTLRAGQGTLRGAPPRLQMAPLLRIARSWGQGSDAVFAALSPEARGIVLQPRQDLTPARREFSERVDLAGIDPALHVAVRAIRTLKRPG